jgi:valyl-tRNA synthetase
MFFQCAHISKKIPLKTIFLHGLMLDAKGHKMSKSLGNGIDPMQVIEQYGADALRTFLTSTATMGEDLCYSEEKIKYYATFINKIWNAHNLLSNYPYKKVSLNNLHLFDQ